MIINRIKCLYKIQQMSFQRVEPLKQIIRYEEQLRAVTQRIQVMILDDNPTQINSIGELISEQEQLIKYLQVQSTKLGPETKQIYTKNMARYKKKAKQHREYIGTMHGSRALPPKSQQQLFMDYQNQNMALAQNKIVMYQNQRVQQSMGRELYDQGQTLYGGIQKNRQLRRQADQADNSIKLIKLSIMKRKLMFFSLIGLFIVTLIFVIIVKIKRK